MLVNLPLLKNAFLKSALAPEGQPTPEASLLLALSAYMTASTDEPQQAENAALNVIGDGSPWSALTLRDALFHSPGLIRISAIYNGEVERDISALTTNLGSGADSDYFRRLEQAKSKKPSGKSKRKGASDTIRMVHCYIEVKDEEAVKLKQGSKWLNDKWGGLPVVLPADEDFPELTGTIHGFEWNATAGLQVCTVDDGTDSLTPVGVQEVPGMVKNARQADDVFLIFEESDDEYEPDGACDINRMDAPFDSEVVDMEHEKSNENDIVTIGSETETAAIPAQSQHESRGLRRSARNRSSI